jgi:four helix bundle protein
VRDFHRLKVWERAHEFTLKIYQMTKGFPREELYGITSQMRRAAASIPTNIAEGCGRSSKPETIQFLNIAAGSASEIEYQLILVKDLQYIDEKSYNELLNDLSEVRKMLYAFAQKLKTDLQAG